ncbi:MAG: hypothetical protein AABM32_02545 [Chloroflexota bacterium]
MAGYVDRIEAYQREWLLDTYFVLTGERATSDRGIHERYRELNDGRLFQAALEHGDRPYARALVNAYFAAAPALAEAGDRLRTARPSLVVEVDGVSLGIPQLRMRAASETDAAKRAALESAALDLVERRAILEKAWIEAHAGVSRSLGFARHLDLIEALEGDVGPWLRHAERWLEESRADFLARWRVWRERDQLETGPFTPYLGRDPTLLPGAADMPTSVRATAAGWGFGDIAERIPIDVAPRPGKSMLSFCARIAPPRDVRVTTQGSTNPLMYGVLLHEFGHALHFSLGPDRPFDLYGDHQAVTEAFGMTFMFVASQPDWYERFVGVSISAEDLERLRFVQDLNRRIDATQLLYEHAVHAGAADPPEKFQRLYRREFDADLTAHLAYFRMQLFLEVRPFYPLYLHQANSMRSILWKELCGIGGGQWYLGDRCRPYLVERFRTTCEVDLPEWLTILGSALPSESSDRDPA